MLKFREEKYKYSQGEKKMFRFKTISFLIIVMSLVLAACGATAATEAPADTKLVGISMPTKTSTRWISDGESMVKSFQELGYETDLQFADNDTRNRSPRSKNGPRAPSASVAAIEVHPVSVMQGEGSGVSESRMIA